MFLIMGRLARVVAVDVPHHLTQRGNDRRFILDCDADRATYLSLLRENIEFYRVSVMGYCLMSNHVHLIVVPRTADGLAQALKQTHGRYASYWNTVHRASGHVWQGRYYSCPLDEPHLWEALRYTELNPLRARLVATPESGLGRAPPATAEQKSPMSGYLWSGGAPIGLLRAGDSTSPQGRWNRSLLSFASARTPVDHGEVPNSSMAWRGQRSGD
jgi:REP element-mobilizing transposase RayT